MSVAFPYKCAACKARFASIKTAERHIQRKHGCMGIIVYAYNGPRSTRRTVRRIDSAVKVKP